MTRSRLPIWIRRGILAALGASGLLFSWGLERSSIERANRLHRAGNTTASAVLYRAHTDDSEDPATLAYNLGTSLLDIGSPSAQLELATGTRSSDAEVSARAYYNSGVLSLTRALEDGDSIRAYATAAVAANREALKLRPDHRNTKWNLAMAQRLLDSLDAADRRSGRETAEGAVEVDEIVNSENVDDAEADDELPEDRPREGEDEAAASGEDDQALTLAEAEEILGRGDPSGAVIVRKLIALESRSFWGRRTGGGGHRR